MNGVVVVQVCKRDESLEQEEYIGRPPTVDNDQLKVTLKAGALRTIY